MWNDNESMHILWWHYWKFICENDSPRSQYGVGWWVIGKEIEMNTENFPDQFGCEESQICDWKEKNGGMRIFYLLSPPPLPNGSDLGMSKNG